MGPRDVHSKCLGNRCSSPELVSWKEVAVQDPHGENITALDMRFFRTRQDAQSCRGLPGSPKGWCGRELRLGQLDQERFLVVLAHGKQRLEADGNLLGTAPQRTRLR